MSGISPVQSHLTLNPYLYEVPQKTASNLRCKALTLNVLEKITWVAIIAIVGTVLAVSHMGIILTGYLPMILVGLVLCTVPMAMGASKLNAHVKDYSEKAARAKLIAEKFEEIKNWKREEITHFFNSQGLILDRLPIDELRKINPNEPLCALLPLIALYMQLSIESKHYSDRASINLQAQDDHRISRLANRQIGWRQLEEYAIPRALDAALVLEITQQPTLHMSMKDLCIYHAKSFEERMFDRQFYPANDNYLVFNENLNRPPLTLAELLQDLDPKNLRSRLFPQENRA